MSGRELTEMQQRFVVEFINHGGNRTKAAKAAGYSVDTAHQAGHRLVKQPHVLEAIRKEAENHLNANVAVAAEVLVDLAKNGRSKSVRLQAALALLDRGGLPFIHKSEHMHVVKDHRTDEELMARVRELMGSLGLDATVIDGKPEKPKKLAIADDVTDIDFMT